MTHPAPLRSDTNFPQAPPAVHSPEAEKHRFDPLIRCPLDYISTNQLGVGVVLGGVSNTAKLEIDLVGRPQILLEHAGRLGGAHMKAVVKSQLPDSAPCKSVRLTTGPARRRNVVVAIAYRDMAKAERNDLLERAASGVLAEDAEQVVVIGFNARNEDYPYSCIAVFS